MKRVLGSHSARSPQTPSARKSPASATPDHRQNGVRKFNRPRRVKTSRARAESPCRKLGGAEEVRPRQSFLILFDTAIDGQFILLRDGLPPERSSEVVEPDQPSPRSATPLDE
jgi:hypothetical protein